MSAQQQQAVILDLQQQLVGIKHRFADAVWRSFILIVLVGVPLSLARTLTTGWLPIYTLHLVLGTLVLVIALYCHRLSLLTKSALLLLVFWLIGLPGVLTFGMASPGIWWLVVSCLLAHVLYSPKVAMAFAIFTLLVMSLIAVAFVQKVLQLQIDTNVYLVHPSSWATYLIVNSMMFFVVLRALMSYSEASKATAQHQFRQWIDDLPLGILVRGQHGKPYYQNHAANDMLGPMFDPDSPQPANTGVLHCVTGQPYPVDELPAMRALKGETCMMDDLLIEKAGQQRYLRAWGRPGYTAQGELAFGIAAFEDITEAKRLDLLKNQFVSTVSHELRTPLTSIRGALGLILGKTLGEPPPQMLQMLEIANQNSLRLLRLINDILDMQKMEAGQMDFQFQPVDMVQLTHQAVAELQSYASSYQVSYQFHPELTELWVQADANRFMQVLANLLSNAAKFSPPGSVVQLTLALITADRVQLKVTDQGPGIDESFRPRIFQPFNQFDAADNRSLGGTGLGLSISKAIVERHQGRIYFANEASGGCSFVVELPLQ